MRDSTIIQLQALAPALLLGKQLNPCPVGVQRAMSILEILKDGQWHKKQDIASQLEITPKYVGDILRACKKAWGLKSSPKHGWVLHKDKV